MSDNQHINGLTEFEPTVQVSHSELQSTLAGMVDQVVRQYFVQLDGEMPTQLYDLILAEIEKPLLAVVMEMAGGNQSKTAEMLGLNRGTLRKKLLTYELL